MLVEWFDRFGKLRAGESAREEALLGAHLYVAAKAATHKTLSDGLWGAALPPGAGKGKSNSRSLTLVREIRATGFGMTRAGRTYWVRGLDDALFSGGYCSVGPAICCGVVWVAVWKRLGESVPVLWRGDQYRVRESNSARRRSGSRQRAESRRNTSRAGPTSSWLAVERALRSWLPLRRG